MKGMLDCFYTISPIKYLGSYLANLEASWLPLLSSRWGSDMYNSLLIPQRNLSLFKVKCNKTNKKMCEGSQIYLDKMCQWKDAASSVTRNMADALFVVMCLNLEKCYSGKECPSLKSEVVRKVADFALTPSKVLHLSSWNIRKSKKLTISGPQA